MRIVLSNLMAICLLATLFGCGPTSQPSAEPEAMPIDESTPTERKLIESKIKEISDIAEKLGYKEGFTEVPVYVTSADLKLTAYCRTDGSRRGQVIVLTRKALSSGRKHYDKLFGILLHEIGHCYFSRDHETRKLKIDQKKFVIQVKDNNKKKKISGRALPTSMMYTGPGSLQFLDNPELKKYYVAEILGGEAWQSTSDVTQQKSIRIEKDEEEKEERKLSDLTSSLQNSLRDSLQSRALHSAGPVSGDTTVEPRDEEENSHNEWCRHKEI